MPRPTKCTPKVREAILNYARVAVPMWLACKAAGLDDRTIRIWRKRAKAGDEPYAAFIAELEQAHNEAKGKLAMRVFMGARDDWRAGAWMLARMDPENFGDKIQLRIEEGLQRFLDVAEHVCAPQEFARLLEALASATGRETPEADPSSNA